MSTELFSTLPYKVADITLADFGRKEIDLAEKEMPGLTACIRFQMIPCPDMWRSMGNGLPRRPCPSASPESSTGPTAKPDSGP